MCHFCVLELIDTLTFYLTSFLKYRICFLGHLGSQQNWAGSTKSCHILPPLLPHPTQAFRLNVPHQDIGQSGWTDTDTPLSSLVAYTGFSLCWMFYGVLTNTGWHVSPSSVVSLSFNMSVSHLYSWWIFLPSIAFSGHSRLWEFAIL